MIRGNITHEFAAEELGRNNFRPQWSSSLWECAPAEYSYARQGQSPCNCLLFLRDRKFSGRGTTMEDLKESTKRQGLRVEDKKRRRIRKKGSYS